MTTTVKNEFSRRLLLFMLLNNTNMNFFRDNIIRNSFRMIRITSILLSVNYRQPYCVNKNYI